MVVFVEDGPEIGWAELGDDDDDNVKGDGDVIVVAFVAEGNSFIFGGLGGLGGGGGPGS